MDNIKLIGIDLNNKIYTSDTIDLFSGITKLIWSPTKNNDKFIDIQRLNDGKWLLVDINNDLVIYNNINDLLNGSNKRIITIGKFNSITQSYDFKNKVNNGIFGIGMDNKIYKIFLEPDRFEFFTEIVKGISIGNDADNGYLIVPQFDYSLKYLSPTNVNSNGLIPHSCCAAYFKSIVNNDFYSTQNYTYRVNMILSGRRIFYTNKNTLIDNIGYPYNLFLFTNDSPIGLMAVEQLPIQCNYNENNIELFTQIFSNEHSFKKSFLFSLFILLIIFFVTLS